MRENETVSLMESGVATETDEQGGIVGVPSAGAGRIHGTGRVLERGDKGNRPSYSRTLDKSTRLV
jgi:hypothetical protein